MPVLPLTSSFGDNKWEGVKSAIQSQACVPIIGAEACDSRRPLYAEIATEWATHYDYPFEDTDNLPRVAQHVANTITQRGAKCEFVARLKEKFPGEAYFQGSEPHTLLARLRLPVYLTTNYDDYMFHALELQNRKPTRDYCRWNSDPIRERAPTRRSDPDVANPLVYYCNGQADTPASLALTEDDYLDLLANVSRDETRIPNRPVRDALGSGMLLFLGFRLTDWDFRVLARCIASQIKSENGPHVAVQLAPVGPAARQEQIDKAVAYLDQYFDVRYNQVKVFLGTCQEFMNLMLARCPELFKG